MNKFVDRYVQRLMPDCGGPIKQLAVNVLPNGHPNAERDGLTTIGNLLRQLENDVCVIILTEEETRKEIEDWVSGLAVNFTWQVCSPGVKGKYQLNSYWLQDRFLVVGKALPGEFALIAGTLLQTHLYPRQAAPISVEAKILQSQWKSDLGIHIPQFCPEGGGWLTGPLQSLVNTDVFSSGLARGPTERILGAFDTRRRLDFVGFYPSQWKAILQAAIAELKFGTQRRSVLGILEHRINNEFLWVILRTLLVVLSKWNILKAGDHSLAHLDMLMTVTGVTATTKNGDKTDRKPVIVFGMPLKSTALPKDWCRNFKKYIPAKPNCVMQCLALELCDQLVELGYSVVKVPIPFLREPDAQEFLRCYNNVILQNDPAIVWLPQFADREPELLDFDIENVRIWQSLGFEVRKVPGFSVFYRKSGAIRCMTKVLERGEWVKSHEVEIPESSCH